MSRPKSIFITGAAAGIDREPRTWERPSDHTPAWVELRD